MKYFEIYNKTTSESIVVIEAKNIGDAWDRVNEFAPTATILDINVKSI